VTQLTSESVLVPLGYGVDAPPVILTVDTSGIAVGWCLSQMKNDVRRPARFGARLLHDAQKNYSQLKKELWGMMIALKSDVIYLRGANLIIETDCLPLLGIIKNCEHADSHVLRWVAFVRSYAPELRHISGESNVVADMLSRARFSEIPDNHGKMTDDPYVLTGRELSVSAIAQPPDLLGGASSAALDGDDVMNVFKADSYKDDSVLRTIGKYLSSRETASPEQLLIEFSASIRRSALGFLLIDGYLYKRGTPPKRVVGNLEDRRAILHDLHDTPWGGHRGENATYIKVKDRYWWPKFSVDVKRYVATCTVCQMYSKRREKDPLTPSVPQGLHSTWVFDLVTMPKSSEGHRYLAVAREDLSNYVEATALRTKVTKRICQFILNDILA
jgi:hypothetical protein